MPTQSNISISQVRTKDTSLVALLLSELLDELAGGEGTPKQELEQTAETLLSQGLVTGLIAYSKGEPVGVIMLNECAAIYAGGRFAEITELYVKPSQRSQGVAPQLIAAARDLARKKGWRRLEVGAPDQPAWRRTLEFYIREGFEEVGPRLRLLV
ncbi:MAG: GNAT family N-acetyltransferase [Pseudomonadota bacterium]